MVNRWLKDFIEKGIEEQNSKREYDLKKFQSS